MNTKNKQFVHKYKRLLRLKKGETIYIPLKPPFCKTYMIVAQQQYN